MSDQQFSTRILRFYLDDRTGDGSGGPSIRVHGPATDNTDRQLLRFDCFKVAPHYHLDPDGRDEFIRLEGEAGENSLAWSVKQLATNLPDLVRRAGGSSEAVAYAGSTVVKTDLTELLAKLQDAGYTEALS